MSNTIQIKRSSTAASVPTAGQLAVGELAVNLADKKLFTKDASNTVFELGVALTGNQTIAGVKTFSSSPVVPNATTSGQAVNKGQMDEKGITSATAVTASGTSVDFTGIPAWVKRITVIMNGVSTNGTSNYLIQLGDSGGIETTGYACGSAAITAGTGLSTSTSGFILRLFAANQSANGAARFNLLSGNTFAGEGTFYDGVGSQGIVTMAGSKTLSDTLDRIRITTVNGTDVFDTGTINIFMEG